MRNQKSDGGGLASVSLIIALLDRLATAIYQVITQSYLFGLLTSYSKEQRVFEKNGIKKIWNRQTKLRSKLKQFRYWLSNALENSFLTVAGRKLNRNLLSLPLNAYGNFLLTFGIYTILVYFVGWIVPGIETSDMGYLITGIGLCLVSVPLLFAKASLLTAVKRGKLTRLLFMKAFSFRDETFTASKKRVRGNGMIILGMLCGFLTLVISPITIIKIILLFVGLAILFVKPEVGIPAALFCLPFLSFADHPTIILAGLILITFFAYLFKLLRGKRVFKLEILDAFVLLFGAILLFSGIFSAGGIASLEAALLSIILMLGYFLVINLMRTTKWLKCCIVMLATSSIIVALIGGLEYLFGELNVSWLDTEYFPDIKGRVVSLFENSNVLGAYLVMTFPFVLLLFARQSNPRVKNLLFLGSIIMVLCNVVTWSRGAWLAMLISTVLFLLIYSKKTFRLLFAAILFVPFLPSILPQNVIKRFLSIGDLTDTSTTYRVYTWQGTWAAIKENLFSGVGYGTDAYQAVYPSYAYAGMEAAEHSHSLFLQILFAMGICGLIVFCLVMLLSFQQSSEFIYHEKSEDARLSVTAVLCSMVAALLMGTVDYIWFNYRVFFLFWTIMALACAYIRIQKEEISRKQDLQYSTDPTSASLDLSV